MEANFMAAGIAATAEQYQNNMCQPPMNSSLGLNQIQNDPAGAGLHPYINYTRNFQGMYPGMASTPLPMFAAAVPGQLLPGYGFLPNPIYHAMQMQQAQAYQTQLAQILLCSQPGYNPALDALINQSQMSPISNICVTERLSWNAMKAMQITQSSQTKEKRLKEIAKPIGNPSVSSDDESDHESNNMNVTSSYMNTRPKSSNYHMNKRRKSVNDAHQDKELIRELNSGRKIKQEENEDVDIESLRSFNVLSNESYAQNSKQFSYDASRTESGSRDDKNPNQEESHSLDNDSVKSEVFHQLDLTIQHKLNPSNSSSSKSSISSSTRATRAALSGGDDIDSTNESPDHNERYYWNSTSESDAESYLPSGSVPNEKGLKFENCVTVDQIKKKLFKKSKYSCNKCEKKFLYISQLRIHLKSHEVKSCKKCGESYFGRDDLLKHNAAKHAKKSQDNQQNLKTPVKNDMQTVLKTPTKDTDVMKTVKTGTPKKVIECPACQIILKRSADLMRHIRANHDDEGKYPCKWCNKRFWFWQSRNKHIRDECQKVPYNSNGLMNGLNDSEKIEVVAHN